MKQDKELNLKQIKRRVGFIRFILKFGAKQMVDMKNTIGKKVDFETEKGVVSGLTYGFENKNVTPLLVNFHGSGFTLGSAGMDDPFMMQFVEKCAVKVINVDYALAPETERFKDLLIKAGVKVKFKRFEGAFHGFTVITEKQAKRQPEIQKKCAQAWQMMIDFVNENI